MHLKLDFIYEHRFQGADSSVREISTTTEVEYFECSEKVLYGAVHSTYIYVYALN